MLKRMGVVAVAIIAVSIGARGESRLSADPDWFMVPGESADLLEGIGDNGFKVDPYRWTLVFSGGSCTTLKVAAWILRDQCADDDGCRVRLAADGSLGRLMGAPQSFVTDDAVERWFVTTSSGGFSTYNKDFNRVVVTELGLSAEDSCAFVDDLDDDDGPWFHLEACAGIDELISCTLRIDD